jgi:hypothetical protein
MKILGITDEVNTCDCCGRTNLKKTVAMEFDAGGMVHYGADCAANAVYGKKTPTNRKLVEAKANAAAYVTKWTAVHGTDVAVLEKIAAAVRTKFCGAFVKNGEIVLA